ncbi:HslU--HslV peptidase ATPase subunit [Bombilactobacillus bombi]|uniref:ATP-dependent protease ATPase subunit HslU n=1 Tax=Bombilactobacillus bombi TaxID=1303590 RepID=A0A347SRA3_9LACO|nr:ATP-dependent protease ATPase subunit HslU [Bombilactobacillus bombi]AXX64562.1 ATP-dependent protease ATPase subunit HslU [Bombilactobacillus bombi]RHW46966.1 HslU--HslV peptidase ATPase subunit [Bombilactobacillus bombi]RHW49883.1 HslU--HslV peptidase ATPase subunit [Bombilactobacillus bombi]
MTTQMTPKQIVQQLDKYIIGQDEAKKAVAIALYNRYRRMQLSEAMQQDITPKNLLMIGPTGVGKTEIARRLAKVVQAPFVKVEATKFTEVGYVGRDVESMIRDLVDVAVKIEEDIQYRDVRSQATREADKQLVKLLVPGVKKEPKQINGIQDMMAAFNSLSQGENPVPNNEEVTDDVRNQRLSVKEQLDKGLLEDEEVTIQVEESHKVNPMNDMMGQMGIDLNSAMDSILPKKKVSRTLPVKEAREVLIEQESSKLVDHDAIYQAAIQRAENDGIIFIDEIDKITAGNKKNSGEVSREGVQRDILPIVEGSSVNTKYGTVKTDHILFIGSGAFAESKPSDLIAELQGRFPIRVELNDLSENDFIRILTAPDNALVKQYIAMIGSDGIHLTFTKESIEEIARIAYKVNHESQNIGARRLATVLEKVLEEIMYEAPDMQMGDITITQEYVDQKVGTIADDNDLTKYIL